MLKFSSLVAAALFFVSVDSKFLQTPKDATLTQYDFIIVGGGAAGSIMASRLSETSAKVLLIEAGGPDSGPTESIPFACTSLAPFKGPWDWNYTVSPQEALGGRTFAFPRGRVLGGTTAINYMIYNPGGSDEYDRFAEISGNDRWNWENIQPYRMKIEGFVPPLDRTSDSKFVLEYHGHQGPIKTTLPLYPTDIDERIVAATSQIDGYPYRQDMNGGDEIGIGYIYASIGSHTGGPPGRITSSAAYILPVIHRQNFDVLIDTQVIKLLQTGTVKGVPIFRGVEFSQGPNQPIYSIVASKEVILSAGAIGTPQLLMLSGIGGKEELAKHDINAIVDLPDVGRNFQDHPLMPYQWEVNSSSTWDSMRDPAVMEKWHELYSRNATGPLVNTVSNQVAWLRVPEDSDIWEGEPDPSAGPTCAHFEMIFGNGFLGPLQTPPSEGNYMTFVLNLVSPASRGTITLNSTSPWDSPIIDPAYFSNRIDLRIMREALKAAKKFVTAPAFSDYVIKPYLDEPVETDEEIDAFVQKWTSTVWHPAGTATISRDDSDDGVVDSELNVKKVRGLRIVDASVMPWVPSAHPQAPIYILAEITSDIIKNEHRLWEHHYPISLTSSYIISQAFDLVSSGVQQVLSS